MESGAHPRLADDVSIPQSGAGKAEWNRGRTDHGRWMGSCTESFGDPSADLRVAVRVHDHRFYRAIALGGSMGAGGGLHVMVTGRATI